jgi:hypothetical protein
MHHCVLLPALPLLLAARHLSSSPAPHQAPLRHRNPSELPEPLPLQPSAADPLQLPVRASPLFLFFCCRAVETNPFLSSVQGPPTGARAHSPFAIAAALLSCTAAPTEMPPQAVPLLPVEAPSLSPRCLPPSASVGAAISQAPPPLLFLRLTRVVGIEGPRLCETPLEPSTAPPSSSFGLRTTNPSCTAHRHRHRSPETAPPPPRSSSNQKPP